MQRHACGDTQSERSDDQGQSRMKADPGD
jgi:hypothetical protein